ncbi:hypothetical protein T07_13119, partial [Trichinella nelsoni]
MVLVLKFFPQRCLSNDSAFCYVVCALTTMQHVQSENGKTNLPQFEWYLTP